MPEVNIVVAGNIVNPKSLGDISIYSGYISVINGKIVKMGPKEEFLTRMKSEGFPGCTVIEMADDSFVMPGFIDCHTHAPQFPNIGLGLDLPLLEWLEKYTFPMEMKYVDKRFASAVYDRVVKTIQNNGTTTACFFGSLHLEGTMELVEKVLHHKQRALVGKVSMNMENHAGYYNKTEKELEDVELFITRVQKTMSGLVTPVVTPRFALSCDQELLTGLGNLAAKYKCLVQSHISENVKEVEAVLQLHPDCKNYGEVYNKTNIFNNKCILAHAVHLTDEEIALLAAKGVSIAHCPASNTRLQSGLCPVRKLIDNNITVGLGTDVSGGDSVSILDAMRRTMDVSTHLNLMGHHGAPINWKEAIYLATLGGAKALKMDDVIGSFEVGKEFDALLIANAPVGSTDSYNFDDIEPAQVDAEGLVQRFVYLGTERNIATIFIKGTQVKNMSR